MQQILTAKKLGLKVALAAAVLIIVMCICTMVGTGKVSLSNVFAGAGAGPGENIDYEIFVGVRLPRVILAALVVAALACAGLVLQAILRNPLADPYILGISSGAGLGVIVAILSGVSWTFLGGSAITIFAFIGSLATVWLVWAIAHFAAKSQITSLLLAGVVVNAFFSAVIMFLTSIAKSEQFYSTILWLMGNITAKPPLFLVVAAGGIGAGIAVLFVSSHKLNVLTLGEDQAKSLGVNSARLKILGFTFCALITAIAVSVSGLIGFVGLIIPHAARLVFGPDHRQLLPLSALIGATFLVAADTISRTIIAPAQLPVGVITAIAGGPFFLILLARYTRRVSWLSK